MFGGLSEKDRPPASLTAKNPKAAAIARCLTQGCALPERFHGTLYRNVYLHYDTNCDIIR